MNLVLCVGIKGAQNSQVFFTTISSFLWLNRTLCGITWQCTLLGKKEIIVQRRRGFSTLLFPLHLARRDRNSVNLGLESWWVCTMHYDTSLYSAGCKEKMDVEEAIFWSTVSKINIREPSGKYSLLFLTFLIPFNILEFSNPQIPKKTKNNTQVREKKFTDLFKNFVQNFLI